MKETAPLMEIKWAHLAGQSLERWEGGPAPVLVSNGCNSQLPALHLHPNPPTNLKPRLL